VTPRVLETDHEFVEHVMELIERHILCHHLVTASSTTREALRAVKPVARDGQELTRTDVFSGDVQNLDEPLVDNCPQGASPSHRRSRGVAPALLERDVEARLSLPGTLQEELQSERASADAGNCLKRS